MERLRDNPTSALVPQLTEGARRRRIAAALATASLVLLSACAGGDDNGGTARGTTAPPTSSAAARTGGPGQEAGSPAEESGPADAQTEAAGAQTEADLQAVILRTGDLAEFQITEVPGRNRDVPPTRARPPACQPVENVRLEAFTPEPSATARRYAVATTEIYTLSLHDALPI